SLSRRGRRERRLRSCPGGRWRGGHPRRGAERHGRDRGDAVGGLLRIPGGAARSFRRRGSGEAGDVPSAIALMIAPVDAAIAVRPLARTSRRRAEPECVTCITAIERLLHTPRALRRSAFRLRIAYAARRRDVDASSKLPYSLLRRSGRAAEGGGLENRWPARA